MPLQCLDTFPATDQQSRLCLLRREDGLFQYRLDHLISDDEDFEPYWREGYPLSRLYATTSQALSAAAEEFGGQFGDGWQDNTGTVGVRVAF